MTDFDRSIYLHYLKLVPLFSACSSEELDDVADRAHVRTALVGEVIVKEGDAGDEFFVIGSGRADVARGGHHVATLGQGDYFGELALFDPEPRNATVTASSQLTVLILGRDEFRSLLDTSPAVRANVFRGMARRLHTLDARF